MKSTVLCRMCGKSIGVSPEHKEVTCPHCRQHQPVTASRGDFPRLAQVPNPEKYLEPPQHNGVNHWSPRV